MIRRPPRSTRTDTLFPYTTLFRSRPAAAGGARSKARMKVAVLGSGIIGISSARWLRQAGHDVVVVDRRPGPAQETSLANGGQISVSYAEPWANPQAPLKLLTWMRSEGRRVGKGGVCTCKSRWEPHP